LAAVSTSQLKVPQAQEAQAGAHGRAKIAWFKSASCQCRTHAADCHQGVGERVACAISLLIKLVRFCLASILQRKDRNPFLDRFKYLDLIELIEVNTCRVLVQNHEISELSNFD
jgi:hypothetical protein